MIHLRSFRQLSRHLAGLLLTLVMITAPGLAYAQGSNSKDCENAVRERLNLAIGFYRIEIAASHFITQYNEASQNSARRAKLEEARKALTDLHKSLNTQLAQTISTADANGVCHNISGVLTNVHSALELYGQVVQDRWQFMQQRLHLLKKLKPGAALPGDFREAELWVQEPRARYDVWRHLAQTRTVSPETSAALYVLGMLSRVEWHTAMALYSSLQNDKAKLNLRPPATHMQNAAKDATALKNNWPEPAGQPNNTLWVNLKTIAKALPDTRPQDIPKAAPAEGWAAWIGNWIDNYGTVFTRSIPKALSALEDVADQ